MKQPILLIQGQEDWLQIENAAQNTVVQVFAQIGKFNWLEPYKVEAQFESRGTGFFVNDQGYLFTNAHVVNEAKTVWITIPALGRETIRVEVVGFCPDRDFALLKVIDKDLERVRAILGRVPFLMLGNSDQVQRTDKILVLGYPLGQHRIKSSTGIVSGRESVDSISYIQITAPINPGSSGGPLISMQGSIVGITVASNAYALNVGYAIPINELNVVFEDLLKTALVRKPILGGRFHNATDDHARFLGNPLPAGLYLHKVLKGSLLEKGGLLPGDMLYEFNGNRLDPYGDAMVPWSSDKVSLYDQISRLATGQKVKLLLYRAGEKKEINFILELFPAYPIRVKYPDYEEVEHEVIGGMVVMELAQNHVPLLLRTAPFLIKFQKVENTFDPVLIITHILPGSRAQQLRSLIPGAIIRTVNGTTVRTVKEFRDVLRAGAQKEFLSLVTADDVLAVFPLKKVLADEKRLSRDFAYPLSEIVQELLTMVTNEKTS